MESGSVAAGEQAEGPRHPIRWRLWALVPIILLVGAVSIFAATGGSLVALDLVGTNPPPADEFEIRRVEFKPGEIRVKVTNPQRDDLTIASVTVDDAIVNFDGPVTLGRLGSSTIVIPFFWVEEDPYVIGVTSSSGIETTVEIGAAIETPTATARGWLGYAIIGFLVGIVPVALGIAWLPSLRHLDPKWLSAFMALTAGLLVFLAVDAFAEALELQAALPSALGGIGLVLFGVAASYLTLAWVAGRFSVRGGKERSAALSGLALATLVAIGIGLHNLGEGLAIGSSFALSEIVLGSFLIVGFMVHNITEGLGIAAPIAEGNLPAGIGKLTGLVLIAGAPTIFGAWIGGFLTNDFLGVLFFAIAVGAALQVVVEVGRFVARRSPGGLSSGYVIGGFLAGVLVMYLTGLLVG